MSESEDKSKANRITSKQLFDLLNEQQFRCALTGEKLKPSTVEADHIIPLEKGGQNCIENIQLVLGEINRMKSTMDQDRFVELCTKVAEWNI
ncbi:HNH endonuclease [Roseiconus lacunae]|uniref:HNH endonuclease n=1 Tax=Roseiconus lacunae TaxID=2605694 RepID=UPI001E56AD21|nr:HNH endonuclease signature motif containing protein [Roseiconus lacunae]MCD0459152.1 HNH endonuclease [Roseiconus lacunae]